MRAPMHRAQAPLTRSAKPSQNPASLRLASSHGVLTPWELPPARARSAGRDRRTVRLPASVYRRRRRAAGALAVGLVAALAWVASIAVASFGSPEMPSGPGGNGSARTATYVVQRGDTIWSIAERFARPGEVGSMSDRLMRANGGSQLQVGQALVIPVGA